MEIAIIFLFIMGLTIGWTSTLVITAMAFTALVINKKMHDKRIKEVELQRQRELERRENPTPHDLMMMRIRVRRAMRTLGYLPATT